LPPSSNEPSGDLAALATLGAPLPQASHSPSLRARGHCGAGSAVAAACATALHVGASLYSGLLYERARIRSVRPVPQRLGTVLCPAVMRHCVAERSRPAKYNDLTCLAGGARPLSGSLSRSLVPSEVCPRIRALVTIAAPSITTATWRLHNLRLGRVTIAAPSITTATWRLHNLRLGRLGHLRRPHRRRSSGWPRESRNAWWHHRPAGCRSTPFDC